MKTLNQVMTALKKKGSAQTRKIYERHGCPDNFFGVKVADIKTIAKQIKGNQELALQLFDSGNADAMYLAGVVADGRQMNKTQLNKWAKTAPWYMVSEYSVPGVASESEHGRDLAAKWIKSKQENVAASGWSTYAALVSITDDSELDLKEIESLLKKAEKEIHTAPNRVRYTMNGFVIAVGGYVKKLSKKATTVANKIGKVHVEMGETSCKVPLASDYIKKVVNRSAFKKRKTAKC